MAEKLVIPEGTFLVGKSHKPELLALKLANRHGLVTGRPARARR